MHTNAQEFSSEWFGSLSPRVVELIAAVEWIVEGPEVWPVSVDDPRARRYLPSRFLYSILYIAAVGGDITVAAVAPTKRKPGYSLRRLSELGARTSKAVLPFAAGFRDLPAATGHENLSESSESL